MAKGAKSNDRRAISPGGWHYKKQATVPLCARMRCGHHLCDSFFVFEKAVGWDELEVIFPKPWQKGNTSNENYRNIKETR